MRRPFDVPLSLELLPVLIEDAVIMPRPYEFAERGLAEMMNEGVRRADNSVAFLFDADRIIVVLEHSDAELFIEFADLLEHVPPHRDAKHCQHVDVGDPSVIVP